MTRHLMSVFAVGLLAAGIPAATPKVDSTAIQLAGKKNCRMVDMCWFKDGKKYCFKKLVCD